MAGLPSLDCDVVNVLLADASAALHGSASDLLGAASSDGAGCLAASECSTVPGTVDLSAIFDVSAAWLPRKIIRLILASIVRNIATPAELEVQSPDSSSYLPDFRHPYFHQAQILAPVTLYETRQCPFRFAQGKTVDAGCRMPDAGCRMPVVISTNYSHNRTWRSSLPTQDFPTHQAMSDIKDPRLIYAKGFLFLLGGLLAAFLLLLEHPTLKVLLLLAICVWCFARFYYFAFYVIEHYTDAGYRYAGLWSFAQHVARKAAKRRK